MKRFLLFVLQIVMVGIIGVFFKVENVLADDMPSMMDLIKESNYEVLESDRPKSAVLIDGNTGKFLWGENQDLPHNPASVVKLMVLYLVYEAMEEGKFDLETKVTATPRHQQIANIYEISNNNIIADVDYPVNELISMALVPSSNIATMMLAELIEPDANAFLELMNKKAQELGMTQTKFVNATGAEISAFQGLYSLDEVDKTKLDIEGSNTSTARDFSIFTYHLLKKYPEILESTKTNKITVMAGTPYEEVFDTYNHSLPGSEYEFDGVDGLKTGSSSSGAFNIDITAQRDDLRLIALVFGVGDWSDQTGESKRHPFANAILDYGFNNFEYKEVLPKGEHDFDGKLVVLSEPIKDVVKKGETPKFELLANNQVVTQNSLEQITEEIKPQATTYEEVEALNIEKDKQEKNDLISKITDIVDFSNPIVRMLAIAFIIIFLLIILVIVLLVRDKKRRKNK